MVLRFGPWSRKFYIQESSFIVGMLLYIKKKGILKTLLLNSRSKLNTYAHHKIIQKGLSNRLNLNRKTTNLKQTLYTPSGFVRNVNKSP